MYGRHMKPINVMATTLIFSVAATACGSSDNGTPSEEESVKGCGTTTLLARPADRSAKGPWAVGAKQTVDGMKVEIWYPAAAGSDAGKPALKYDIRADLPADQAAKISDADSPLQPCDCVRDLPMDTVHGPYPLVVFIHGTAGFKTQNLDNAVHWASRGFVVMSANHPGLEIASFVGGGGGMANLAANVKSEVAAITAASGELAMFAGHVDTTNIGLVGHSAGGNGVASMDITNARVVIPLAAGGVVKGANVESTLYVGGEEDTVIRFAQVSTGYDTVAANKHKRLVGVKGAGHTGVTSLCGIRNNAGKSIVEVARTTGVLAGPLGMFADTLFDCSKNTTPTPELLSAVNYATSAALEETLQCDTSATGAMDGIKAAQSAVSEYKHQP
jgi:hypothetical protein